MTSTIAVRDLTRRYRESTRPREVTLDIARTPSPACSAATAPARARSCASWPPKSSGLGQRTGLRRRTRSRTTRCCAGWSSSGRTRATPTTRSVRSSGPHRGSIPTGARNWPSRSSMTSSLPRNRAVKKLSRGMRSAVGIVIGLAARAELTMLDEPYAGLDAVARHLFYDRLLADYAEHPRTVLLSTHLIDEVADLLEHVVMIDHGRIAMDAPADDVRGHAATVSGPRGRAGVRLRPAGPAPPLDALAGLGRHHRGAGRYDRLGPWKCTSTCSHCPPGADGAHLGISARKRGEAHEHLVKVARYHLVNRIGFVILPLGVLTFVFLIWRSSSGPSPPRPADRTSAPWPRSSSSSSFSACKAWPNRCRSGSRWASAAAPTTSAPCCW